MFVAIILCCRDVLSHFSDCALTCKLSMTCSTFAAGPEARRTRDDHHSRGLGPDGGKPDWPKGLPERQTQLQTQVQPLSRRIGDSAGVLPASGRLCEVQHASLY